MAGGGMGGQNMAARGMGPMMGRGMMGRGLGMSGPGLPGSTYQADPSGGYGGNASMGGSTGAGGIGFQQPRADPSGGYTGNVSMGGSTGNGGQPFMSPTDSSQAPQQQRTGTWLDDYLNPGTQDGVALGFTGTQNGHNYINGNPYAAEYMSQGTDPNTPSYAFAQIMNAYAPQIAQMTGQGQRQFAVPQAGGLLTGGQNMLNRGSGPNIPSMFPNPNQLNRGAGPNIPGQVPNQLPQQQNPFARIGGANAVTRFYQR